MRKPVYAGYLADPFLTRIADGFVVYGTADPATGAGFEAIVSSDLVGWESAGMVFSPPDDSLGTAYWAPEVAREGGRYWMFYSVGHGIVGHHIRVASSAFPLGPFIDEGVNLTPDESFAIDPHPFRDSDGTWYLFFARDVLDSLTPGTHLAVIRLAGMLATTGSSRAVLAPYAPWQIYEHDRLMYGQRRDWYTLEGPAVVLHDGLYHLFYSGGSWEGDTYGVAHATAPTVLGPWRYQGGLGPTVLNSASTGLSGPGHNSVLAGANGHYLVAYHAWDSSHSRRQTYIDPLEWEEGMPVVAPNRALGMP